MPIKNRNLTKMLRMCSWLMDLAPLKQKLFFTVQDVATAAGTTLSSAHVLCSRYTRKSIFLRIKKNFYVLADNWDRYGTEEFFKIANFLMVPSYVSCTTALAFHGYSTQVQRNWFECVATRRSIDIEAHGATFIYHKFQKRLFFGFERRNGIFIATPEKAVLDAAYMEALGLSATDWDALSLGGMDKLRIERWAASFPSRFKRKLLQKCGI